MTTQPKSLKRTPKSQTRKVSVPIHSVTFWLNAFLPRDIAGETSTLRQGPFAGYTAIIGPHCCLTDQRNFSNDMRAQSRMQSRLHLNFGSSTPTLTQMQRCDVTTECDITTDDVILRRKAGTERMTCMLTAIEPQVVVHMNCHTSNPGTSASWAFGDIDYVGMMVIDPVARSLAVDLKIGLFPAFEGYASINDGPAVTVFRYAPPAGFGPGRVPSGASRPIRAFLADRDGDGVFEAVTQ